MKTMGEQPIVSTLWLRTVAQFLEDNGTDPTPLLRQFDLTDEHLLDCDEWHPLATFIGMQEEAAALTGDPHFGMRMGLSYEPRQTGPLGYSMMHARTVRDSLRLVVRYQSMHLRGTALHLHDDADPARLTYRVEDPTLRPRVQDALAAVATGIKMVRCLGPQEWSPPRIWFEHEARDSDGVLTELLGTKVEHGRPMNALFVEQSVLDSAVHGADEGLGSVLERHLELLARRPPKLAAKADTLVARVQKVVAAQIHDGEPSLEGAAKALGTSSRTLQRELRKRSTAFRELVEELRRDLALEYMRETDTAITQVAFMLGYSELSAFDRAFRRWTGISPKAHRRQASA